MSKPGNLTPAKPADKYIQEICDKVKPQAEQMVGRSFPVFEAKSYSILAVNGMIYIIKVLIGDGEYVHLRVYDFLKKLTLQTVIFGIDVDDPIVYF